MYEYKFPSQYETIELIFFLIHQKELTEKENLIFRDIR